MSQLLRAKMRRGQDYDDRGRKSEDERIKEEINVCVTNSVCDLCVIGLCSGASS